MTFNIVVAELGTYFTDTFSEMLINYIYNNWTTNTGDLAKPGTMTGESNTIEFRRGFPSDFKQLDVTAIEGETMADQIIQFGQKILTMKTQVIITLRVQALSQDDPDEILSIMEKELRNICLTYKQSAQSGDMRGIKDLVYERARRVYLPSDTWDKSEWGSEHSIQMWYQLNDVQ